MRWGGYGGKAQERDKGDTWLLAVPSDTAIQEQHGSRNRCGRNGKVAQEFEQGHVEVTRKQLEVEPRAEV
jgi:hypothetical protein